MAERNRRGGPRDQARGAASRAQSQKLPPGKQGQSVPPGKQGAKKRVTPGDAADGLDERAAQLAEPLRRVLQRLPETQRRVLELRMGLVDGHPQDPADAARTLGMSLGELREIETRAFERIREVIPLQQLQRFLER
jgi:DNA-directed RNA polymerase specialized sigma24 family protein